MSTIIDQINKLKAEKQALYEENTVLNANVESLNNQIERLEGTLKLVQDLFEKALDSVKTTYNDLFTTQNIEIKKLIDSANINITALMEANDRLQQEKEVALQEADKWKTQLNTYMKAHP